MAKRKSKRKSKRRTPRRKTPRRKSKRRTPRRKTPRRKSKGKSKRKTSRRKSRKRSRKTRRKPRKTRRKSRKRSRKSRKRSRRNKNGGFLNQTELKDPKVRIRRPGAVERHYEQVEEIERECIKNVQDRLARRLRLLNESERRKEEGTQLSILKQKQPTKQPTNSKKKTQKRGLGKLFRKRRK